MAPVMRDRECGFCRHKRREDNDMTKPNFRDAVKETEPGCMVYRPAAPSADAVLTVQVQRMPVQIDGNTE